MTMISIGSIVMGEDHLPINPRHIEGLLSGEIIDDRLIEVKPIQGITAIDKVGEKWPLYEIKNGRHRFLAAIMLGALNVDCRII